MSILRRSILAAALLVVAAAQSPLAAQAYSYPSLQSSRISEREYNFGFADGGRAGTSLLFQWREGLDQSKVQLSMDIGLADPDALGADTRFLIAGGVGYQAYRATSEIPFDVVLTGGIGGSFGDNASVLRVPIGASVGHRFPLEGRFAITPYAHPRLSLDRCSKCGTNGGSDSKVSVDVDLGVNFEITDQVALRASALFGGNSFNGEGDAFGFSVAWTPRGLRK